MLGYMRDEVAGHDPQLFIDHSRRRELDDRLDRGETFTGIELRMRTKDDRRIYVSASGAPVYDGIGELFGHMWVLLDITERKRAEETLRKSEKLASAGRMAAVIAHEINNPLEAITNLLYLLGTEKLPDQARAYLQLADSELKRVVHIARQTLGFYRESNKPQQILLADVFDQVAEVYAHKMRKRHIGLVHDFQCRGEVLAYPGEVRQLFTNLISNAIDPTARACESISRVEGALSLGLTAHVHGQRQGHRRGGDATHLRTLLHDQRRKRDWARSLGESRHRA
jgi:signal transduction histidine kinase